MSGEWYPDNSAAASNYTQSFDIGNWFVPDWTYRPWPQLGWVDVHVCCSGCHCKCACCNSQTVCPSCGGKGTVPKIGHPCQPWPSITTSDTVSTTNQFTLISQYLTNKYET